MIREETQDGIRRLIIDRPEQRNAIDTATARTLGDALRAAGAETGVRVLVIEGAGGTFSTGRDLKASAATAGACGGRTIRQSACARVANMEESWRRNGVARRMPSASRRRRARR